MKIQINRDIRAIVFDWPFDHITSEQLNVLQTWLHSEEIDGSLPLELVGMKCVDAYYTNASVHRA